MLRLIVCFASLALVCRAEVAPVSMLDIEKYVGSWYQVFTNQKALDTTRQDAGFCPYIQYGILNATAVSVDNRFRPGSVTADEDVTLGVATTTDNPGVLAVKFDGIPATFSYWVLKLGPVVNDQYDYAVVSDGRINTLYVLVRDYESYDAKYNTAVQQFLAESDFTGPDKQPLASPQGDGCVYNFTNSAAAVGGSLTMCFAIFTLKRII